MQPAIKLCITLSVILFVLLILYLVIRLFRRLRAVILLQEVADNPKLRNPVGRMLSVYYRRLPVFHNLSIPFRTRDGVVMCRVQYLMVNRGGILLIAACPQRGFVENPFQGDWRVFTRDAVRRFPNPLETNTANARMINALLKRNRIQNIPIRAIAVFPAENNRYKNRIEQVMPLSRLRGYIHDMNKNRFLSHREIRRVASVLRHAAVNEKQQKEHSASSAS